MFLNLSFRELKTPGNFFLSGCHSSVGKYEKKHIWKLRHFFNLATDCSLQLHSCGFVGETSSANQWETTTLSWSEWSGNFVVKQWLCRLGQNKVEVTVYYAVIEVLWLIPWDSSVKCSFFNPSCFSLLWSTQGHW